MTESSKHRILLVDDNRHLLVTLSDYLSYKNFAVTCAESAEEALEQLDSCKPHLIVLDISMPGMGGLGFLKQISGDDGALRYPVLVLTARAALEEFFGSVPVHGFIAKPCSEEELVEKIHSILAQQMPSAAPVHQGVVRFLLAEDDLSLSTRIHKAFRERWPTCEFEVVGKGTDVLEKAVLSPQDVILIKQVIHGMNGAEVVSLLGQIPKISHVPVILYSEDGEAERGRAHVAWPSHRNIRAVSHATPQSLMHAVEIVRRTAAH